MTTYRTKTETMVNALAKAVWSDAVVVLQGPRARVTIAGTEPPLRGCMVQVDVIASREASAWRKALARLRYLAARKATAEAKRAETLRAQAARHDAHAAALVAALNGGAS